MSSPWRFRRHLALVGLLLAGSLAATASAQSDSKTQGMKFVYQVGKRVIERSPSSRFVAVKQANEEVIGALKEKLHLSAIPPTEIRDPGRSRLTVLQIPSDEDYSLSEQWSRVTEAGGREVQPVFESGQAILIPNNQLIVRVNSISLDELKQTLQEDFPDQGITGTKSHRKNALLVSISNPSKARNYEVARVLAEKLGDKVKYVEPNHQVLFFNEPEKFVPAGDSVPLDASPKAPKPLVPGGNPGALNLAAQPIDVAVDGQPVALDDSSGSCQLAWTVLLDQSFEDSNLAGWTTGSETTDDVLWSVTTERSHAGNRSLYATGGGSDGVAAPGPYPNGSESWIETPELDLDGMAEVYVEMWFYAKYAMVPSLGVRDYARVSVRDGSTLSRLDFLAVSYTGDLTADSTTDSGWRRILMRVPPSVRKDDVKLRVDFRSDAANSDEGLYVDEIRVVALPNWPAAGDSDMDPYAIRQYELKNCGQIAGLGDDDDDLNAIEALEKVGGSVASDIIVAVIDDGVDLDHPDLNLIDGFDWDGTSGGEARGNHGTACAGDVGAIANNGIGVVGTAPGVKIMPIYSGGTLASLSASLTVAADKEATIASNSWGLGGGFYSADLEDSCAEALDAGVHLVFAAGNGPDRPPFDYQVAFPGSLSNDLPLICVGACSPTGEHKATASSDGAHAWGSSYVGDGPNVVAPSPWGYTTDRRGADGYNSGALIDPADTASADYTPSFGGTSHSTPLVSGVLALVLTANPDLTPAEAKEVLMETATDIDQPGNDAKTGAGRVNALAAVEKAIALRD